MLTLSEFPAPVPRPAEAQPAADASTINRVLAAGELLFREGDARDHVFRVEQGAVCLFRLGGDDSRDVIEFAFPGDYVGLGYLDHHVCSAEATVETTLSCHPRPNLTPTVARTPATASRMTAAIEREVTFLREAQARVERSDPITRAAALFVTLSRCNAYEGRDPALIADSLTCGVVAGYLDMTVDDLARVLKMLEARNLVEVAAGGLRLKNLDALEKLADGGGRNGSATL